ncbi:MAG: hypothetical protein ABSA06_02850 [Geobacteraceae bacterium]
MERQGYRIGLAISLPFNHSKISIYHLPVDTLAWQQCRWVLECFGKQFPCVISVEPRRFISDTSPKSDAYFFLIYVFVPLKITPLRQSFD